MPKLLPEMFFASFNPPPVDLMLTADDVHIWYASLDAPISRFQIFLKTLSPDERMRAERFHFDKDRKCFIASRWILRTVLGRYLGVEPKHLQFSYGKNGKPTLVDQIYQRTIRFNLSHSNGVALFAFTLGREIGIDIEKVRDISEMTQIAERFFSMREYGLFSSLPKCKMKEAFFNCWTQKEAFIKAIGDGLALPLDSFEVSFILGKPAKLLNTHGHAKEIVHWFLQAFTPSPGYIGAFAVAGDNWRLACWQWEWGEY